MHFVPTKKTTVEPHGKSERNQVTFRPRKLWPNFLQEFNRRGQHHSSCCTTPLDQIGSLNFRKVLPMFTGIIVLLLRWSAAFALRTNGLETAIEHEIKSRIVQNQLNIRVLTTCANHCKPQNSLLNHTAHCTSSSKVWTQPSYFQAKEALAELPAGIQQKRPTSLKLLHNTVGPDWQLKFSEGSPHVHWHHCPLAALKCCLRFENERAWNSHRARNQKPHSAKSTEH